LYGLLLATLSLTAFNLQRNEVFGPSPESRMLLHTTLQEELENQAEDIDAFARQEGHLPFSLSELPSLPYGEGWEYVRLTSDHYHLSLYQDGEFVVFDSNDGIVDPVNPGSEHEENTK
jgi:hypothetical protein